MKPRLPVLLLILLLWSAPAAAQDTAPPPGQPQAPKPGASSGLDEALGGFEEPPKPVKKKPDTSGVDEALGGFGDDPAQPESAGDKEAGGIDQALQGFGDTSQEQPGAGDQDAGPLLPPWLDISGELTFFGVMNPGHDAPASGGTDHRGLSSLKGTLRLQADMEVTEGWKARLSGNAYYDLAYSLNGRDDYTASQLDSQEQDAEIFEAWLRGGLASWLDIKLGRQIVVWGKSDNLRVTDVLNPLDSRVPGLTDIEDLRLPVMMTRLDAYSGSWTLSGYVIHEPRFNKTAPFGSDFYLGGATPEPPVERPGWSMDNQEYALSLSGSFSGWDMALYSAYLFSDQGHLEFTPTGAVRRHERLFMLGAALNAAWGSWLLKAELAHFTGLEFGNDPGADYQQSEVMLGAEYSGFSDTTISLEWALAWLWAFDPALEAAPDMAREDRHRWALRITRDFMREELELTLLATAFGPDLSGGSFVRIQLDYDWGKGLHTKGGVVFYQSGGQPPFLKVNPNDRVFLELEYSF
jgi:hypothetical protein